jgi:RHS repeat-associated protein
MKHSPAKLVISPQLLVRFILAFSALTLVSQLRGQVGNDNPTGPSGMFNGNITTGCSYDPYTGNATRTVTDIVVSGAVGEYPLAFSRTYNSRNAGGGLWFGGAGGWHHNYEWSLEDSVVRTTPNVQPTSYTVDFPDGRSERFVFSSSDPGYFRPLAGIGDRFQPLNASLLAYLVFPDGGKVEFKATQKQYLDPCCPDGGCGMCTYYYYSFVAQAIIDPYGLKTTLTYNTDTTLQKITEPAGRTLTLTYGVVGQKVISTVTSSDGRAVNYSYIQSTFPPNTSPATALDHVIYYGTSTWTAYYTYQGPNGPYPYAPPLLLTADDAMYPGPMKRIAYTYRTTPNQDNSAPVYGQISSENYYDGTSIGAAVSTLTVTGPTTRMETRGDGKTRTFTYQSGGYLSSCTDFKGVSASQTYDANMYINSVTDRNLHTTNFTSDAHTGLVTQIQYPLTQGDTPGQTQRPTVNYTYTNDYYLYSSQDEIGKTTTFTRDPNTHRITQIGYPDNGYETFTLYNNFGEFLNHRLKTGGTETFTYDGRGLKLTYRNPSNPTGNPTAQYQYDALDRVSGVTDALGSTSGDPNHTTSFTYNARGQVTVITHPNDPIDAQRHTIINGYNPDGTLASTTDELSHVSQFTYDQYKRLRTAKTPDRFTGDTTPHTTSSFYDANGTADDYTHADANPTYITLPGGERSRTAYDENFRKTSVTAAFGTTDAATTSFGYDNVGNVTSVKSPKEQPGQPYANKSTIAAYDERNRVMSVTDARAGATSYTYDFAGHKASITRPNGQVTTYDAYDAMNRLLQQTVKQTPDPDAVTKFTYDSTGSDLFYTMQDPRLVAVASPEKYTFNFDQMGRQTSTVYPPAVNGGASTSESFTYDAAGRLYKFTNRNAKVQTFTYDRLNRPTNIAWNDSGLTPTVTFTYDVAMRVKSINNANATISRTYFNDNLLNTETNTYPGADNTARTVTYTYDADARRATLQYPTNAISFTYNYTNRSQLWKISNTSGGAVLVTNLYDPDGNLVTRTPNNSTSSTYTYDVLDRVTNISHALNGTTRTLQYDYDSVGNRKWTKRDGAKGDVFGYDLNDQSTSMLRDILNPDTTAPGLQTINYDANGNRTSFAAYAPTATYVPNNLSQYASRNSVSAGYDTKGNLTNGFDGSVYTYDAQNRLLSAAKGGVTDTFKYDGLNRQILRTVNGVPIYSIYDGWDLIAEYAPGGTSSSTAYLSGPGGLVKSLTSNRYYYQDASGSTSHLASSTGALLEWYRYDLQGTPVFYDPTNTQRTSSAYSEGHLFTGQQWYRELGLYDLRNRFYSPDVGRFVQADPIGFNGDATNLYRYCGNNPQAFSDPSGLDQLLHPNERQGDITFEVPQFRGGGGGSTGGGEGGGGFSVSSGPLGSQIEIVNGRVGGASFPGLGFSGPRDYLAPREPADPPSAAGGRNGGHWRPGHRRGIPDNPFDNPLSLNLGPDPLQPAALPYFDQYTINISPRLPYVGTAFGFQFSISSTIYGQTFYSAGVQVGRAPGVVSFSGTRNFLTSRYSPNSSGMSQALTHLGWNAGGGVLVGPQWSGSFNGWRPQLSSYGGGIMLPSWQAGVGITYGWGD